MGNPSTLHRGDTIHMFDICTAPEMILLSGNGGTHHEFLRAHKVGCTVPSTPKWEVVAKDSSCVVWYRTGFDSAALRRKYADEFVCVEGYGTARA